MPTSVFGSPMSIVIAVQSALTIQLPVTVLCAQTLQPVAEPMVLTPLPAVSTPAPLVAAPAPLCTAMVSVADFDPTVADCNPLVALEAPVPMHIAVQLAQAVLSLQAPQPVTTPLPAVMTPLVMSGPAPLLTPMVAVTEFDPHATDRNPLVADVAPAAIVIAVLLPVPVEDLEAVEPMTSPAVATPTPLRMAPNPLGFAMITVTLPDPLVTDRVPVSTLPTPVTVVVAVQPCLCTRFSNGTTTSRATDICATAIGSGPNATVCGRGACDESEPTGA